ncbi:MAG: tetratricopeptide repeat protein [Chthonomonas sp.]|nr:tetratricopeptide repeat protein [Chthonomonas sp.]
MANRKLRVFFAHTSEFARLRGKLKKSFKKMSEGCDVQVELVAWNAVLPQSPKRVQDVFNGLIADCELFLLPVGLSLGRESDIPGIGSYCEEEFHVACDLRTKQIRDTGTAALHIALFVREGGSDTTDSRVSKFVEKVSPDFIFAKYRNDHHLQHDIEELVRKYLSGEYPNKELASRPVVYNREASEMRDQLHIQSLELLADFATSLYSGKLVRAGEISDEIARSAKVEGDVLREFSSIVADTISIARSGPNTADAMRGKVMSNLTKLGRLVSAMLEGNFADQVTLVQQIDGMEGEWHRIQLEVAYRKRDFDFIIADQQPRFGPGCDPSVPANLALCYFRKGDFRRAVEFSDLALEGRRTIPLARSLWMAQEQRSWICLAMGDYDDSRFWIQKCLNSCLHEGAHVAALRISRSMLLKYQEAKAAESEVTKLMNGLLRTSNDFPEDVALLMRLWLELCLLDEESVISLLLKNDNALISLCKGSMRDNLCVAELLRDVGILALRKQHREGISVILCCYEQVIMRQTPGRNLSSDILNFFMYHFIRANSSGSVCVFGFDGEKLNYLKEHNMLPTVISDTLTTTSPNSAA